MSPNNDIAIPGVEATETILMRNHIPRMGAHSVVTLDQTRTEPLLVIRFVPRRAKSQTVRIPRHRWHELVAAIAEAERLVGEP